LEKSAVAIQAAKQIIKVVQGMACQRRDEFAKGRTLRMGWMIRRSQAWFVTVLCVMTFWTFLREFSPF
jgi:hypothetical protein